MKVTREEFQAIQDNTREIAVQYVVPLDKEKMVGLILLAATQLGSSIIGKNPESVDDAKETLKVGLDFLLTSYSIAKADHTAIKSTGEIDAALTTTIGHA